MVLGSHQAGLNHFGISTIFLSVPLLLERSDCELLLQMSRAIGPTHLYSNMLRNSSTSSIWRDHIFSISFLVHLWKEASESWNRILVHYTNHFSPLSAKMGNLESFILKMKFLWVILTLLTVRFSYFDFDTQCIP